MTTYDVAIVGGGIVGLATALALVRRHRVRLIVIEAEQRLAAHQTGHNSGVIHAGLYYKPGSLKARYCVKGRESLYHFCAEQGIPHERCGKLVVATRPEELPALAELEKRGQANGIEGLQRVEGDALREYEPHVRGLAGLHVPVTGIVNYATVAAAYGRLIEAGGGEIRLDHCLRGIVRSDPLRLSTTGQDVEAKHLICCAGLQADRLTRLCGVDPGIRIVPFRGEYYQLVPERETLVRNLIYPVPDPRFPFLGVHFTRMIGGGIEAGPNAVLALRRYGYRMRDVSLRDTFDTLTYPGFWRLARPYWRTGMGEIWRSLNKGAFVRALQRLLPELQPADVVPAGAGVRAQALLPDGRLVDDFHFVEEGPMLHVLNAPSPAATASLVLGEEIARRAAARFGFYNGH